MSIFSILLTVSLTLLNNIIELFPLADTNNIEEINNSITIVNNVIGSANYYLPMELLATIFSIMITIETSLFLYHTYDYIHKKATRTG